MNPNILDKLRSTINHASARFGRRDRRVSFDDKSLDYYINKKDDALLRGDEAEANLIQHRIDDLQYYNEGNQNLANEAWVTLGKLIEADKNFVGPRLPYSQKYPIKTFVDRE